MSDAPHADIMKICSGFSAFCQTINPLLYLLVANSQDGVQAGQHLNIYNPMIVQLFFLIILTPTLLSLSCLPGANQQGMNLYELLSRRYVCLLTKTVAIS